MRLTLARGGNSSWSLLSPHPCLSRIHSVSICENMPTLPSSPSAFLHSCMILLQLPLNFILVITFPPSHHYISFSSSSSPPRVDSSPGMTLPRPFNRREEGRPPTGWRLQVFLFKSAPPVATRRRKERVKPFSTGRLVVSVSLSTREGNKGKYKQGG